MVIVNLKNMFKTCFKSEGEGGGHQSIKGYENIRITHQKSVKKFYVM